jgi:hypothetical protein
VVTRRRRAQREQDEDEAMLDVAVHMSLENATSGSSADSRDQLREMTSRAAELRRSRSTAGEAIDVDALSDALSALTTDDESDVPLAKKKGKGKGRGEVMTLKELRKQQRLEKAGANAKKKLLRAEEKRLRRELGRPLIQVWSIYYSSSIKHRLKPII